MASHSPSHVDTHEQLHLVSPDAAAAAIGALRAHGERVTDARRAVIELLAGTHEHVSADQVATLLEASRPVVHRATVYRTLDVLAELGIVSHIHSGSGATAYHLAASPEGHEHLHAHCRSCGAVIVIPADALADASARVARETGFTIEAQQSMIVGVCASCVET